MSLLASVAMAASPVIGTAAAQGSFHVDHAAVRGNATLFEGSLLETGAAASRVELAGGTRLLVAASSRGRLFSGRLVLEQGETRLEQGRGFHLEALGLRIAARPGLAEPATLNVAATGDRVEVAALSGALEVRNASGQLVANLFPGTALAFAPQAEAATRVTGCLEQRSGRYLVTDEITNVTVEAAGAGLAGEAGNRVELTGTLDSSVTPQEPAAEHLRVTRMRRVEEGCGDNGAVAAAAGVGAAAGAATAAGISATTIAVIGGVAAAATVGGLAAAQALPGQGDDFDDTQSISR